MSQVYKEKFQSQISLRYKISRGWKLILNAAAGWRNFTCNTFDSFLTCLFPFGCPVKITPMAKSYARRNPIQKKKWMTKKSWKYPATSKMAEFTLEIENPYMTSFPFCFENGTGRVHTRRENWKSKQILTKQNERMIRHIYRLLHGWWVRTIFIPSRGESQTNERVFERVSLRFFAIRE